MGFDPEQDADFLAELSGKKAEDRLLETLVNSYQTWPLTAWAPEEEREREGNATPEQCKKNFLQNIDEEIDHLMQCQKARASIEFKRRELESVRQLVPDGPGVVTALVCFSLSTCLASAKKAFQ